MSWRMRVFQHIYINAYLHKAVELIFELTLISVNRLDVKYDEVCGNL